MQLQLHAGWDVFILWYDVKEPLSSVITGQAMSGYLRLFRLLWTLKRVEHTLNRVWQVMSGIQRQLATIQGLTSQYGLPCPGEMACDAPRDCHKDHGHIKLAMKVALCLCSSSDVPSEFHSLCFMGIELGTAHSI